MQALFERVSLLLESVKNHLQQAIIFLVILASSALTFEAEAAVTTGDALLAKYSELGAALKNNQFKRELYLVSNESDDHLQGEIYAVVNYPFNSVNKALNNPKNWCDVLILHINIKYCFASPDSGGTLLTVDLGKKFEQPLDDTYRVSFDYQTLAADSNYFAIALAAKDGPLATHDYEILVEATPVGDKRTFLHFTYAYSFGLKGKLAMKAYLATKGKDKVGFTVVNKNAANDQKYIKGVRGVIERNTMRYYLAIDAYLAALASPKPTQLEKRFANWYDSTRQYSRQLYEVEREDYLAMKRKEYQRQQTPQGQG